VDRLKRLEDGVLRALERSRSVALEEAQTVRVDRVRDVAEKEAAHEEIARARESAYDARRKQIVGGGAFSIQQLHWNHQYAASQLAQEHAAHAICEQARLALRQAQEEALHRLEELRVVEKLRARRRDESARLSGRRAQERLDELGLIKAWNTNKERTWPLSVE
jgi:hypothetical protein